MFPIVAFADCEEFLKELAELSVKHKLVINEVFTVGPMIPCMTDGQYTGDKVRPNCFQFRVKNY